MSDDFIFTSESVTKGHPDKLCDQVSDGIVDRFLMQDPNSSIVAECAVSSGVMFISAHFASMAKLDIPEVARGVIRDIGYSKDVFDADACTVMTSFMDHTASDYRPLNLKEMDDSDIDRVVAKHQVTVFGYACDQTPALMPLPIWHANLLVKKLDSPQLRKTLPYLLPDGKSQVGIEYQNREPKRVHSITLVASQTEESAADSERLRKDLIEHLVGPAFKNETFQPDDMTQIFINPEGPLIGGGPAVHSGLTGRKTGIDTYGEFARHSGAGLSGKDPMRIDRIGAYAARYAAKNVVAAGLARKCEVTLSYSIGSARPVSLRVRTFDTGVIDDQKLSERLVDIYDFRVAAIIRDLELQTRPSAETGFYQKLAVYGHMGRVDLNVPWEDTTKADALK
ncbi:MAG: methionine adenosyltransferase [Gammaproteobacteria bacterium]|nr:methionine adenosyltransferase [Gammaproteobacteria bacterium]